MYSSFFYRIFKFHFITLFCTSCILWRPCATDEGRLSKWYDMIWIWYEIAGVVNKPGASQHIVRSVRQGDVRRRRCWWRWRSLRSIWTLRGRRQRLEPHQPVVRRLGDRLQPGWRRGHLPAWTRCPEVRLPPTTSLSRTSPFADTNGSVRRSDARLQKRLEYYKDQTRGVTRNLIWVGINCTISNLSWVKETKNHIKIYLRSTDLGGGVYIPIYPPVATPLDQTFHMICYLTSH